MGLSSSSGIFRELCSSRALGLREVTPGQQADGAGEMGESHQVEGASDPLCCCVSENPAQLCLPHQKMLHPPRPASWRYQSHSVGEVVDQCRPSRGFFRADPPCRSPGPGMCRAGLLNSPALCFFSQILHATSFYLGAASVKVNFFSIWNGQ